VDKEPLSNEDERADSNALFIEAYNQLVIAFEEKSSEGFDKYVNGKFYLINSSGATPEIKAISSATNLFENSELINLNSKKYLQLSQEPIFDSLPRVICGGEIYNKYGCFAQKINPVLTSQIWKYTDLSEEEKTAFKKTAKGIEITVINTSNFTYYFSNDSGNWFLVILDIRTPCSA
jgi:hypothetical protein